MSEQNSTLVCSMCGIENTVSTCFDEKLNETLHKLYKFADDGQDMKKVRKKLRKNDCRFLS